MFDARHELTRLREQTQTIRKKTYRKSRLDRYTGELLQLYRAGASAAELQRWLREKPGQTVSVLLQHACSTGHPVHMVSGIPTHRNAYGNFSDLDSAGKTH